MSVSVPAPRATIYFFFFNDTATTEIYTLSLHDALPISRSGWPQPSSSSPASRRSSGLGSGARSEEHTSELQSQSNLVCRLLLEKKKNHNKDVELWHAAAANPPEPKPTPFFDPLPLQQHA